MTALAPIRRTSATALVALLTLALSACNAAPGASNAPTSPGSPAPVGVDPGPAIDTDALLGDASTKDGQLVRITGFFLAMDGKAVLCSMVLESYPPQCGGGTVRIIGEVPAEVLARLDRTNDANLAQAQWGYVIVVGTFRASGADGQPTIELGEIALQNEG